MSPKKKKAVVPEVIENEKQFEEKKHAPFLKAEVVPSLQESPLTIYNANPAYGYRWCNKDLMANGRKGIWHTVPKDHEDFAGLKAAVDHSVAQNFFSYRDLVLCCARKETVESKRKVLDAKVKRRDDALQAEEETVIKATKESLRDGIRTLDKASESMESALTI